MSGRLRPPAAGLHTVGRGRMTPPTTDRHPPTEPAVRGRLSHSYRAILSVVAFMGSTPRYQLITEPSVSRLFVPRPVNERLRFSL